MPNPRPPYPPEFRAEAVQLARSSNKLIREIASDLGIAEQTLRNEGSGVLRRRRSIKRVASAVGEGSIAIQLIHDYLGDLWR